MPANLTKIFKKNGHSKFQDFEIIYIFSWFKGNFKLCACLFWKGSNLLFF